MLVSLHDLCILGDNCVSRYLSSTNVINNPKLFLFAMSYINYNLWEGLLILYHIFVAIAIIIVVRVMMLYWYLGNFEVLARCTACIIIIQNFMWWFPAIMHAAARLVTGYISKWICTKVSVTTKRELHRIVKLSSVTQISSLG